MTVGAVIATGMSVSTIVLFAAGVEVQGSNARASGTIVYAALMGAMAVGTVALALLGGARVPDPARVRDRDLVPAADEGGERCSARLLAVTVIAAAGTMFWFLVKAMARIQMPDRRPPA